jgi:hypothetical protein
VLEGVGRVLTLGIEDGHSGRQFLVRYVMVTDYKVYAMFLGISYFIDCLNATVKHYN